jgi:hypothetical protein
VAPDLKPSLFPFQEPIDIRQVLGAGDGVIKRLAVFASRPNRFGRLKSEIPQSAYTSRPTSNICESGSSKIEEANRFRPGKGASGIGNSILPITIRARRNRSPVRDYNAGAAPI